MKTPTNSLDSRILKWSGAALIAFLLAAFAGGSHAATPAASARPAQPTPACHAQARTGDAVRATAASCRS